ncbi:MAG: histidine phosphatase family protein [Alicyclobacillus sp.]|nr:histidine phosphatase family protein [Alicyclobacillus sp.]
MPHLVVVRHAQVTIDPHVPPAQWHLSAEGEAAAAALAADPIWPTIHIIAHSPEPKAKATAHILSSMHSLPLTEEPDLRELEMDAGFLPTDVFLDRVGRFLEGEPDEAFEDYGAATDRIVQCVQRLLLAANGQSVAIVSHGRILTALFSHLLGRRLARQLWQSIRLPDLAVLDVGSPTDVTTWRGVRGFFSDLFEDLCQTDGSVVQKGVGDALMIDGTEKA